MTPVKIKFLPSRCGRPALTRLRQVLLMATIPIFAMGSFCDDNTNTGDGNIDRPAGVVSFRSGDQSYAILPLPQQRHLRVFDLSARLFVPAPNVYFPLSIPVGPFSQKLSLDTTHKVGLVLDSADGAVRAFRLGEASDPSSFTRLGEAWPVGLDPSGIAVDTSAEGLRFYVASAASAQVVQFSSDSDFSAPVLDKAWSVGQQPSDIIFAPETQRIIVSDVQSNQLWIIDTSDDTISTVTLSSPSRKLVLGKASLNADEAAQELVLALPARGEMIAIIDPQATEPLLASVESPSFAVDALVLNGAAGEAMCTDLGRDTACAYAAVLNLEGTITYLDLQARTANDAWSPQFVDGDVLPPLVLDLDENPLLYDPNSEDPDALDRRPVLTTTMDDNPTQPPTIYQRGQGDYLFTFQGLIPALRDRQGQLNLADSSFADLDLGDLDFAGLGVEAGDLLQIPTQNDCPALLLNITQVTPGRLVLAGLDASADCMAQSQGVRYQVRVGQSFTVATQREQDASGLLARVAFDQDFDAHVLQVRLSQAPAGPPDTGAVLDVAVRDNFSPRNLDFGLRGALPSGLSSGLLGTGGDQSFKLLVSVAGGSAMFAALPGIEGYVDSSYLLTGVERFE